MSRILMAYASNSGSTVEVAKVAAEELGKAGHDVEVKRCSDVDSLDNYEYVIVGAPMIFGWHTDALRFIRKHRTTLSSRRTAFFACAMRLTLPDGKTPAFPKLTLDPALVRSPVKSESLSFKERFTTLEHYLKPMIKEISGSNLQNVAFFKGKMEMFRLKWWQAAFVMVVVQAPTGDYRNWDFIRSWANSLFISK